MIRLILTILCIYLNVGAARAQFNNCPSNLISFSFPYPAMSQDCGIQVGFPVCAKEGWSLNAFNGSCQPPQVSAEPVICADGGILAYPSDVSVPRCIKPYQEIQNGQPIPSVFNECIKNRWYEGHFSSPVALCSTAIQQTYGSEDIEKIRECVLSGRFSEIPANPQSYCQIRANEFWSKPENMNQQSVWVPR